MKRIQMLIKGVFIRNRFVENYKNSSNVQSKINMQIITAFAFFLLTIANFFSRSYTMLVFTAFGCVANLIFAIIANNFKNGIICAASSISICSILFGFFIIYGGNDGFSGFWVVLLPLLSMAAMNFVIGLCISIFFQIFLIVIFWTPIREMLFYSYSEQFCLRFPLFFMVTFILGLLLTISLQKSEYNEYKHLSELKKMTADACLLARTDPLTKLANRRCAYEEFEKKYIDEGKVHCIVMGDIDCFKKVNDFYGHQFGDEVLVIIAQCMNELLPPDYLKSRWGGEEFLFVANAPINEVYEKTENLRKAIAEQEFDYNGTPIHITITFGIAEYTDKLGLSKAISIADKRLLAGKLGSKNCTVIAD